MASTVKLSWSTVDVSDARQLAALTAQQGEEAAARVREAVARLQRQGILDAHGRRVRKDTPPDMLPDSGCDMSKL